MVGYKMLTPQLEFLQSCTEAYNTLNMDNIEPFFSENLKTQSFPKTNERPDMSKDEFFQKLRGMSARTAKVEHTIHDLVESPGKIALHLTGKFTTHDGGTHVHDTFVILTLVEEEGRLKITQVKSFFDPTDRDKFEKGIAQVQPLKV